MGVLSGEKHPLQQLHSKKGGGLIFEGGPIFEGLPINRHSTRKKNWGAGICTEEFLLCKSPSCPKSTSEAMKH